MSTRSDRAWSRRAFWAYAACLFTLTHWPKLVVEGPIPRPDLVAHAVAFATWTALCIGAGWFGKPLSPSNLFISLLLSGAYAGVDEGLQAIPFVHRFAALDDFGANMIGVLLAGTTAAILARRAGTIVPARTGSPSP